MWVYIQNHCNFKRNLLQILIEITLKIARLSQYLYMVLTKMPHTPAPIPLLSCSFGDNTSYKAYSVTYFSFSFWSLWYALSWLFSYGKGQGKKNCFPFLDCFPFFFSYLPMERLVWLESFQWVPMAGCSCRVHWFANGHPGEGDANIISLLDGNLLLVSPGFWPG